MDGKQAHRCCEHCRGGHSASHRSTASQTPARFHRRPPRTTSHRSNVLFVEISKAKGEAIGMTLRPSSSGRCIVARIMHGGLAHRTGLIHVRDEILEVNGHVLLGRPVENIQQYLLALQDTVILKISPSTKGHRPPCQMFVRAMFDYKPREDPELPCPELGQPFNVGDILEIVDAADFTWWQARPHNSRAHSHPAGLIPSTDLQESRVVRATNEAREALIAEALNFSNNTTHLSSLLSLLIPRRSRGGGERSSASTSSTGAGATSTELAVAMGTLERTFSHWLPFRRRSSHHRGSSRRLHRRGSSRHRAISATARPSVSEDDDDDDADNDDDGDDAGAGARGRLNGNILDDLSSLGGTIPSQTCSKCNSLLRASVPTTSAQRRQKWAESAPFLLCELPFQPYEEVARRPAFRYRTLVILGAHGVGRRPLRKALIQARPDLFGAVIPHTTRKPEPHEKNGENYYFVQQEEMAADIVSKEFLEYGQFRNILYGTRLDSVRAVMASGRMPVLDVEPKALRILRSAEFAPVVILISPPCLSLLIRDSQHDIINDSLAKLTRESEIMEYVYRPYIDQVVVHHNVEDSTQAIIDYVTRIQMGERWVPISWIY